MNNTNLNFTNYSKETAILIEADWRWKASLLELKLKSPLPNLIDISQSFITNIDSTIVKTISEPVNENKQ